MNLSSHPNKITTTIFIILKFKILLIFNILRRKLVFVILKMTLNIQYTKENISFFYIKNECVNTRVCHKFFYSKIKLLIIY